MSLNIDSLKHHLARKPGTKEIYISINDLVAYITALQLDVS